MDAAEIGQVFTPLEWAEWLIEKWGIFDAWKGGATVCDPTAGQGAFALALLRLAKLRGVNITQELLSRVTLIELHPEHLEVFKRKVFLDFNIDFPPHNLLARDVITAPPKVRFDILIGNPPWANFTDLPMGYKEDLKPFFVAEGLVPDKKKVLLGSSRTDIAALVLKIVLGKLLQRDGIGAFYVPLSLFTGDDAHRGFRDYIANHRRFVVEEVYEFTETKVFHGVGTAYVAAKFRVDKQQIFPVTYFRQADVRWVNHRAVPLGVHSDPWRILADEDADDFKEAIDIKLRPDQKPRQGINTCGANDLFIFNTKPAELPSRFLFPLATKDIWKNSDKLPKKWVLLPYDSTTGRPLPWSRIGEYEQLRNYLKKVKPFLEKRKGTLIRSAISKGIWWSLLGVGAYSFAPYKVTWEAYGKSDFRPLILGEVDGQVWQANQAMQAFIPCWSESNAKRICRGLQHPTILSLLRQLNGNGKCNWAQPGKIKKVLSFGKTGHYQPSFFG